MLTELSQARSNFLSLVGEAHRDCGKSLRDVAELCDVDHSYVSAILAGKRKPRRDVLICLCAFGWGLDRISVDEVLLSAGYPPLGQSVLKEYRQRFGAKQNAIPSACAEGHDDK